MLVCNNLLRMIKLSRLRKGLNKRNFFGFSWLFGKYPGIEDNESKRWKRKRGYERKNDAYNRYNT